MRCHGRYNGTTVQNLTGMNTTLIHLAHNASLGNRGDLFGPSDGYDAPPPLFDKCKKLCNQLTQDEGTCDAFTLSTPPATAEDYNCTLWSCGGGGCQKTPMAGMDTELLHAVEAKNTPTGYAWCLASVVLYAAYEVLYKKFVTDPEPVNHT